MVRTSVRVLLGAAFSLALTFASSGSAQQSMAYPQLVAGQGVQQVPYSTTGEYVTAYGEPIVNPASYNGGMACSGACGGGGCYGCQSGGCQGGCYDGCYGCNGCGNGSGLLGRLGRGGGLGLFSGYGQNTEQCGPHYFDFSGEYLRYSRDKSLIDDSTIISTFGFANDDLANIANQAALTGADVGGGDSNGYRLTGRLDIGALSLFELSYSGLYDEGGEASAFQLGTGSNETLFSIFSRFGTQTNGPLGIGGSAGPPTGEDFEETDNAQQHSIRFESELHNVEASYRRYWVGYSPRISGTLLLGFRYTHLNEEFGFFSDSGSNNNPNGGTINIDFESDNRLAGFQGGGDVWITVVQGLRFGADIRAGIYNNDYQAAGNMNASDGTPAFTTDVNGNQVAFLGEARFSAVADISACLSAKVGYEILYMSDLVLAGSNFDTLMPYGEVNGLTTSPISTNGEAMYHGWHAGLEYVY